MAHPLLRDMRSLVVGVCDALQKTLLDTSAVPFVALTFRFGLLFLLYDGLGQVFFGHSMGGILAYECVVELFHRQVSASSMRICCFPSSRFLFRP